MDHCGLLREFQVPSSPGAIPDATCKTIGFYTRPDFKSLREANDAERADRQVVLRAVEQDGSELEFAAENLRNDFEIFEAAFVKDKVLHLARIWSIVNKSYDTSSSSTAQVQPPSAVGTKLLRTFLLNMLRWAGLRVGHLLRVVLF